MRQPAMSDRARLFVVPLVVLSVVLVALIVAIVVVLVVRGSDRPDASARRAGAGPTSTSPTGASTADAEIDPCVVGMWRITAHREEVTLDSFGKVTLVAEGAGASVRLAADGSGVTDYGAGTRYSGAAAGRAIRLEVRGTVGYRYTAEGGRFAVRDSTSEAKMTVVLDGVRTGEVPFNGSTSAATYECAGDRMVERAEAFQTTFTRIS